MKVKEVARTANVAWSPSALQEIYLACGTVAQQLDATFSTSAKLEIFSLGLTSPGLDMPLIGSVETPQRFHKLVWSGYGVGSDHPSGVIIGGADNGTITTWSADRIIKGASDPVLSQSNQHVGPVRALDVNPFQSNLIASGASESEIFIWDLNSPSNPMSPGNKIHPLEDISSVSWNRQVQYILASTSPSGRSVVWDLRKNEPIIQVTDTSARIQSTAIAWHPDVATQMVTASIDDRNPIIQMWDLRYATAPMRVLEGHKRGILSIAWCPQDSDLLLSAAKDNQVLCWNPNSETTGGEIVYRLPATSQWIFECHWCPRNPAIISTASFDGHVSMYSLLGGGASQVAKQQDAPAATDDIFADIAARPQQSVEAAPLKTPPKWFRRPCGARFSFGGKLVSFGNTKGTPSPKAVYVSQVTTEHELLRRSNALEESLSGQQFVEFCEQKVQESSSAHDRNVWSFLKVTFEPEPRRQYLKLLGYDTEELAEKFSTWSKMSISTLPAAGGLDVNELSQKLSSIPIQEEEGQGEGTREESEASSTVAMFGSEGEAQTSVFDNLSLTTSTDASGRTSKKASNAFLGTSSLPSTGLVIPTDNDTDGMLSKALLVGNFEAAVDICISADRMAEAMVLAVAGGSDLLQRTQQVFFQKRQTRATKLISTVVNRTWTELARHGNLDNWREILAALVTYASPEDFTPLCDLLGARMENELDGCYRDNASLCYICSGNVDKFVECWNAVSESNGANALGLQDLVEKVVFLRKAVEQERKQFGATSSNVLAERLRVYANLLASQGCLGTALGYLQQSGATVSNAILHDRLYQSQAHPTGQKPEFPFQPINVQPQSATPAVPTTRQQDVTTFQPQADVTTGLIPDVTATTANPYALQPRTYLQPLVPTDQPSGGFYGTSVSEPNSFGSQLPGHTYAAITQPLGPSMMTSYSQPLDQGIPPQDVGGINQPLGIQPGNFNPSSQVDVSQPPPPPTGVPAYSRNGTDTYETWNDPPMLRTKKSSATYNPQVPIMAPIMAPVQQPVSQDMATPPIQGHLPLPSDQPTPSPIQKKSPSPAPVIQKPPIPQEHMPMVAAFDATVDRCRSAASTQAVKRKLDDISRKLAILYDLLRESKLSPDVLQGLHYIAHDAQAMNYQSGLARHTHMVSSGNFSEISSFFPGIKALLQLAMQLRV